MKKKNIRIDEIDIKSLEEFADSWVDEVDSFSYLDYACENSDDYSIYSLHEIYNGLESYRTMVALAVITFIHNYNINYGYSETACSLISRLCTQECIYHCYFLVHNVHKDQKDYSFKDSVYEVLTDEMNYYHNELLERTSGEYFDEHFKEDFDRFTNIMLVTFVDDIPLEDLEEA